jgi:hypothetical protein
VTGDATVQPLSDPPTARELAQFLDPDGAAHSFRLETASGETTAHPTGQFGPTAMLFLGFIFAVIAVAIGVQAVLWWRANLVEAVTLVVGMAATLPITAWLLVRVLKWLDQFRLVHGPFARWNAAAGTIDLPRLGVTLRRDQLVGAVCLTGGEWCGGWVRIGAWCPLKDGVPKHALRPEGGWMQLNELSVIVQALDGTLARYPLVTVENPWRFREFAERFAADFGLPLRVIALTRETRRELRRDGWAHAGQFADADRPRKVAAGRIAVCDGPPFFGAVTRCRKGPAAGPRSDATEPSQPGRVPS